MQTVETQIRLLLEKESDQGLGCLSLPLWVHYTEIKMTCSDLTVTTVYNLVSENEGI